jgi:hypothetical protein
MNTNTAASTTGAELTDRLLAQVTTAWHNLAADHQPTARGCTCGARRCTTGRVAVAHLSRDAA